MIGLLPHAELGLYLLIGLAALALGATWVADRRQWHQPFLLAIAVSIAAPLLAIAVEMYDTNSLTAAESGEYSPRRVEQIATGHRPRSIAAGYGYVWVIGLHNRSGEGVLWKIDPRYPTAEAEAIESFVATDPYDIAVGEKAVWVADDGSLIKLDLDGEQVWRRRIGGGGDNEVDVGLGWVWFKQTEPGRLFRLDPESGEKLGTIDIAPQAVALGVGLESIWVTKKGGGRPQMLRVDRSGRVTSRIDVQPDPQDVATGEDLVYVNHGQGNILTRVEPDSGGGGRELPGEMRLPGALPGGLDVEDGTVWVPFNQSGKIFAVADCDWQLLGEARAGSEPADVVAYEGKAYVPNYDGGTVSVFKLKQPACD